MTRMNCETAAYGHYRTRDLYLAWMNALTEGQPDAEVEGQRGRVQVGWCWGRTGCTHWGMG